MASIFINRSEYGSSGNYTSVGITERQDDYVQVAVSLSAELLNKFAPQKNIFANRFREPSFKIHTHKHRNTRAHYYYFYYYYYYY